MVYFFFALSGFALARTLDYSTRNEVKMTAFSVFIFIVSLITGIMLT